MPKVSGKFPAEWFLSPFDHHFKRDQFDCGNSALNEYLLRQASQDIKRNVCRIRVAVSKQDQPSLIGFCAVSSGAAVFANFPENIRKKLPRYPVPIARIGRLAVDKKYQGQGLGSDLLMDAFTQVLEAGKLIGVAAVIVDAKDENAVQFYKKYGFQSFQDKRFELFIMVDTIRGLFTGK